MNFLDLIWLIPLFPAAGFVINGLFGKRMSKTMVGVIACGLVFISFIFSAGAVYQLLQLDSAHRSHTVRLYEWINAGPAHTSEVPLANFRVDWGFLLDPLSSVMILVVTGLGFLIQIYSTGYMHEEDGYYRFFAYLNLFMFSMLTLVLGNNYVMMFVGWEGVGLCSYLLIGYYFHKKSAGDAAKKAFVVNRVGDWGFSIGIMMIFVTFGTIDFIQVGEKIREGVMAGAFHVGDPLFIGIALALFVGAAGKSAQIPLYVWLPDAMEGPTPVSALIHAATMVTAGVYMVARSNFIYQMAPQAMTVVAVIGAVTAFFAASIGLVQNDIKRVLAYSTVSQLGYMFLALGVGAFAAGIFHLMTHAFFKALLFLGSGSVIHALHHEQDMRKMGALKNKIPVTFWTMFVGTLAIAGTPFLAGFFSKDEILWKAFSSNQGHVLLWPLGAAVAMAAASVAIALIGFGLAYSKYCKRSWEEQREIRQYGSLYPVFLNKYYVDQGYDFLFVNRAKDAGTGLWKFDAAVVDGAVNGSAWTTVEGALGSGWWDRWVVDGIVKFIGGFIRTMSWPLRLIQTGYVQNYALVMILGLLIFIGYVLWGTS